MATVDVLQLMEAIYTALNISSITSKLGIYKSLPSLFLAPIVPSGAGRPYISVRPPIGVADIGAKNISGLEVTLEILIVVDADNNESNLIYQLCDLVVDQLNRKQLTLSTDFNILSEAIGRTPSISTDDLNGMLLSFRFWIYQ